MSILGTSQTFLAILGSLVIVNLIVTYAGTGTLQMSWLMFGQTLSKSESLIITVIN
jgi:hypothetical protein